MTRSTVINYDRTQSKAISKYVKPIYSTAKNTGVQYFARLLTFERFVNENYDFSIDDLTIGNGKDEAVKFDVYDLLRNYASWLSEQTNQDGLKSLSAITIKNIVVNAKNFLEYYDIAVNPHKFKMRVKMPRVYMQYKESISRDTIIKILESCEDYKLKTYLICLAVTGARATEMCSIRLKDINWNNNKINIRAEFSKTRVGRYCFITEECKTFLKIWIDYKYRRRRLIDNNSKKMTWMTPIKDDDDLVFSSSFSREFESISNRNHNHNRSHNLNESDQVGNIYTHLSTKFAKLLDQLNIGYEDNTNHRHLYTLHSLRRYLRTLISDLGYQDFAIWSIGHAGSTYWRKSEKEKYQLWKKIEPHLLLLDQTVLQRQGADTQTRLEMMEQENLNLQKTLNEKERKDDDIIGALADTLLNVQRDLEELKKKGIR